MNKIILSMLLLVVVSVINGCASGSYILTGERRDANDPELVKLYTTPPSKYDVIGIVQSSSELGWTKQSAMNAAVVELKKQAAKLGANGIILGGVGESTSTNLSTYGNNTYSSSSKDQFVSGQAIYVIEE